MGVVGYIKFSQRHPAISGEESNLGHKRCSYSIIVQPISMKLGTIVTIYITNNRATNERNHSKDVGARAL